MSVVIRLPLQSAIGGGQLHHGYGLGCSYKTCVFGGEDISRSIRCQAHKIRSVRATSNSCSWRSEIVQPDQAAASAEGCHDGVLGSAGRLWAPASRNIDAARPV